MTKLTKYQKAQLLYKHTTGDFKYRNAKGNKVSRSAWTKMLDALLNNGLIDNSCNVTQKAIDFLNDNHLQISFTALD